MRMFGRAAVSAMTLALAAAFTMGAAHAIQPTGGLAVGSGVERIAEKAKEGDTAKAAKPKKAAAKSKVKTAAAGTKSKAKAGSCGVTKYYDKKTKSCADATLKKTA